MRGTRRNDESHDGAEWERLALESRKRRWCGRHVDFGVKRGKQARVEFECLVRFFHQLDCGVQSAIGSA